MAKSVFMKALHARNFLLKQVPPNLFCQRNLVASKEKDDETTPKKVIVSQEDTILDKPSFKINWKRLKRSWMYYQQYTNFYKDKSAYEDDNNLRLRINKQDEIVYYMRTKEDLNHWYIFILFISR